MRSSTFPFAGLAFFFLLGGTWAGCRDVEVERHPGTCPPSNDSCDSRDVACSERIEGETECFLYRILTNPDGSVPCRLIEGRAANGVCDCPEGRVPIGPCDHPAETIASRPDAALLDCFCEIPQPRGAALASCQNDPAAAPTIDGELVDGWCYVDATHGHETGNPDLVNACRSNEKRILRRLGTAVSPSDAMTFIYCNIP